MAELDARILTKLEQIRVQQNDRLDQLIVEQRTLAKSQENLLGYIMDILRDIRLGLSIAMGEDLTNYSEHDVLNEEGGV